VQAACRDANPTERQACRNGMFRPPWRRPQHIQEAAKNPALSAKVNGGHPAIAATARPGAFTGPGVVGAKGAAPPEAAAGRAFPAADHRQFDEARLRAAVEDLDGGLLVVAGLGEKICCPRRSAGLRS
jgi:hypothetical protein